MQKNPNTKVPSGVHRTNGDRVSARGTLVATVFLLAAAAIGVPQAKAGGDYTVTEPTCSGQVGDLVWVVEQTNKDPNPPSLVQWSENLFTNWADCVNNPKVKDGLEITQSVVFRGGLSPQLGTFRIDGQQAWYDRAGNFNPLVCPKTGTDNDAGNPFVGNIFPPGLFVIGNRNGENDGLRVEIENMGISRVPWLFDIQANATLEIRDSKLENIQNYQGSCTDPLILVGRGAKFVAENVSATDLWVDQGGDLILNAGFTQLRGVDFLFTDGTVVNNNGGLVQIESSKFIASGGGFSAQGITAETKIVNSVWEPDPREGSDFGFKENIVSSGGATTKLEATTLLFSSGYFCEEGCLLKQRGEGLLSATDGGHLGLKSTVVGGYFAADADIETVVVQDGGTFSNDEYTWIQPTAAQDASALQGLDPANPLLTDPPGIPAKMPDPGTSFHTAVAPIVEENGISGVLVEIIPDANCGQDNELTSPINGQCITRDAYGDPRFDVVESDSGVPYPPGTAFRDAGAVQVGHFFRDSGNFSTRLEVTDVGDGFVSVGWTRIKDPVNPIQGYTLEYRAVGTSDWSLVSIIDPLILTETVTGLSNGTPYEFQVIPYNGAGNAPASNVVTATPVGPIVAPSVTAVPDNEQVELNWGEPDGGGRTLFGYLVSYRPTGTEQWSVFGFVDPSMTSTVVTGLKNGTEYEFGVTANFTTGEQSERGTAIATPHGDLGEVNRSPDERYPATKEQNKPRYWESLGYGQCAKVEVADDFGSVWELEAEGVSALILKSDLTNDVWDDPSAGLYGTASAMDISHAIVCAPTP
jgi:hypothetical protein